MDLTKEKQPEKKNKQNEQKLVQMIQNKFIESRTIKSAEEKAWQRQEDFYKGKQWKSKPAYEGQVQPVTNICFSIVESIIPQLTDNRPQIVCLPTEPGDEKKAEILTNIIEYIWDVRDMDYKLIMNERTRIKHGMGIYKVFWNPELLKGLGDIDIINVPLDQFFISPRAKSVQDSDYVIYASQKSTEYIKKRYGKDVQTDTKYDDIAVFDETDDSPKRDNKVLLIEYWTKENGKIRLITIAGDTLLRDEPGFYEHGRYPFVAIPAFPVEKKFWAMGVLAQIISPQMIVNLLDQQILDNARLGGNGTILNGAGSGLNKRTMTNMPYKILDVTDPNQVKIERGQDIPTFIPNHLETKKRDAESVSGIHDVTQGKAPSGVTAASAILALQESANQRVRLLGRTLEAGLKEIGELIIELVREFYQEERIIRVLGDNYKTTFIKFKADELKTKKEYPTMNPETMEQETEEILIDPDFDVRVEVGSSMQYSKAFLYEQAKELFQMQVIDEQALLEVVKFPKAEEVLQRRQEMMQQQAMMEQQMQGGMPGDPMSGDMPMGDMPMDPGANAIPDDRMAFAEFVQSLPPEAQEAVNQALEEGESEEDIIAALMAPPQ
ncbi:portal protein [Cytobacillus sp. FSL R5-0596]|uniref:portal protein n=1 Tax=Cytobacillus sp. FSL R5-0596 TaxID=2954696 RepID=UPI0030F90F8F